MPKFRTKPVEKEAIQWTGENLQEVCDFTGGDENISRQYMTDNLLIETLEGAMKASRGDWIIKGIRGEFYPCKPDIFEKTYEEVV